MTATAPPVTTRSSAAGRLGVILSLTVAILAALGAYPTWRLGQVGALRAAAWAVGLDLAIFAGCGLVMAALAGGASGRLLGLAFLGASILRMAIVLAGGEAIIRWQGLGAAAFWTWAATAYVLMLLGETWWLKGVLFPGERQGNASGGR